MQNEQCILRLTCDDMHGVERPFPGMYTALTTRSHPLSTRYFARNQRLSLNKILIVFGGFEFGFNFFDFVYQLLFCREVELVLRGHYGVVVFGKGHFDESIVLLGT